MPKKLIGLEALRFAAAFAVLIWHYHQFFLSGGSDQEYVTANLPLHQILAPFYIHGSWAVHLFWCISGFIFTWKYTATIGNGDVPFRRFLILRFSRLYPLHCATLLAVTVLQALYFHRNGTFFVYPVNDVRHFALNLLFAQYWGLEDGMSFNGPAWSISAEIPVYMLFFMGCALTGPRSRFRLPLALGMFLALALIGFRFFHHSAVLIAADYFYIGVLSCHLYAAVREMPRPMRIVTTSTIWIVACGSAFLVGWGLMDMENSTLIMFPAFVLAFQLTVPDGNPRGNRCVMFLGDMTYASYLLQFPLQLAIVLLAGWAGLKIEVLCGTHAFLLGYVLIVCTTSRLVFQVFEVPAQNWLRRALLGRPAGAGPVKLASSLGG